MNNLFIETSYIKDKKEKVIKKDNIIITKSIYKGNNYITIEFEEVNSKLEEIVVRYLKYVLNKNNIKDNDKAFVIGLGNDKCIIDSLGCKVIDNIIVNAKDLGRDVISFSPGVKGKTGIESRNIIRDICNSENVDFLILIDSLKSSKINRLNKTIEITDAGILPGSGVGNSRKPINKKEFNIPVIVIGIPLISDSKKLEEMVVISKNIDFIIDYMSKFLAKIINKTLYNIKYRQKN